MFGKICPFCKERIKKDAVICRYCHKELDSSSENNCSSSLWILAGVLGLAVGAAAALAFGIANEKKIWEEESEPDFDFEDEESQAEADISKIQ